MRTREQRGSVTSWSDCHLYRAMWYTLLAAMTGALSLSGIVYFLDRDLAVMYGCGFACYTSHIRPSIRYRAITRTRCNLSEKHVAATDVTNVEKSRQPNVEFYVTLFLLRHFELRTTRKYVSLSSV